MPLHLPFFMFRMLASKTTFWWVKILQQPTGSFYLVVFTSWRSNTKNHTTKKASKTEPKNVYAFYCVPVCLKSLGPLERCAAFCTLFNAFCLWESELTWTNISFSGIFPNAMGFRLCPGWYVYLSDNDRAWCDDSWKVMWMTAPVMSTPSTTLTTTRSIRGFEASWKKTSFDTSNTTPIKSAFSLMRQGSQQTSVPRQGIHAHWQNRLLRKKVLRNEQIGGPLWLLHNLNKSNYSLRPIQFGFKP